MSQALYGSGIVTERKMDAGESKIHINRIGG
jgi:hypothetical protein